MLGLAEYTALSADLYRLAQAAEDNISERITDDTSKRKAIQIALPFVNTYQQSYEALLNRGLNEIALNAASHYKELLSLDVDEEDWAADLVDQQYKERYFGATLEKRLEHNHRKLRTNLTRSAMIGAPMVARLLTHRVPYGAHVNIDRRVLLGTAAKIENDAAKQAAEKSGTVLIRWTLSPRHSLTCMCEDYAKHVSKAVVRYLQDHNMENVDPRGLFFIKDLPHPPHPNCQCEYGMVGARGAVRNGAVKRAATRVRNLIRRIRGR